MAFIKSTKEQCESYDAEVTVGENYTGNVLRWEAPVEIEGNWYISLHPNYPTELEVVESKPQIENDI
jgi:hypothetical protein